MNLKLLSLASRTCFKRHLFILRVWTVGEKRAKGTILDFLVDVVYKLEEFLKNLLPVTVTGATSVVAEV